MAEKNFNRLLEDQWNTFAENIPRHGIDKIEIERMKVTAGLSDDRNIFGTKEFPMRDHELPYKLKSHLGDHSTLEGSLIPILSRMAGNVDDAISPISDDLDLSFTLYDIYEEEECTYEEEESVND